MLGVVLSQLTANYGKVSALSVRKFRVHDHLSMRIDYGTKGKSHITMPKDSKSILGAASEYMYSITETPEDNHLFKVIEDGGTLTGTQVDLFRTLLEKYF